MPTEDRIRLATPHCHVFQDPQPRKGGTVTVRCTRQLRWDHYGGQWICPEHEAVLSGEEAAQWLEEAA